MSELGIVLTVLLSYGELNIYQLQDVQKFSLTAADHAFNADDGLDAEDVFDA